MAWHACRQLTENSQLLKLNQCISASFSESKRELQGFYHYAIYLSASTFCAAESDQASEADLVVLTEHLR